MFGLGETFFIIPALNKLNEINHRTISQQSCHCPQLKAEDAAAEADSLEPFCQCARYFSHEYNNLAGPFVLLYQLYFVLCCRL